MAYVPRQRQGAGWLLFASVVLITAGIMRIFDAFWAWDKDDEISEPLQSLLFDDNLDVYGWLWLIVGVLLIAAGFAVLNGAEWARWFGIGMAVVSAISAMFWIHDFPIWSLVGVLIGGMVVYGLTVYGGRDTAEGPV